jgi:O-antigen/teichoic acid export membrane protein
VNPLLGRLGVHRREHVSVARDFSIYSAVNIASLVLLLGTGLVLRRYVGVTLAGIWTGLEVLPVYAAYAHLGVLNAAERELPFLLGAGRVEEFDRVKHTLLWLSHGLGALLATALVVAAFVLRARIERPFFVGLLVYSPLLWTQILATYYLLLYRARQRFIELSARQAIANVLKAALTVGGGFAFGIYGIFFGLLIASAIQVALFHRGLDESFERHFDRRVVAPLLVEGLPMLAGAVAFETIRNTDRIVIGSVLGFTALGVYSVTQIVCQGIYYLPNALSTVMYPRFQERYGKTGDPKSLQRFVELQLHVLADALLAATLVLLVLLPPAIATWLPAFVGTIPPLRVMLVATYFLCLAPPASQFLLTVRKQTPALLIVVPAALAAAALAFVGAAWGLVGVAVGIACGCVVEFAGINAYALAHFSNARTIALQIAGIAATAAVAIAGILLIERWVPAGPAGFAAVGGWHTVAAGLVALPLLARAARRIAALQMPPAVDKAPAGH